MSQALPIKITIPEFFICYRFIKHQPISHNGIPVPQYKGILDYIHTSLQELAKGSQGDVILLDRHGKELIREKAKFKKDKPFKNKESDKPTAGKFPETHKK